MSRAGALHAVWLLLLFTLPAFALESPTPGGVAEPDTGLIQPQYLEQGEKPEPQEKPAQDAGQQTMPADTPRQSPDTFTPTERIEADSAVSFPVDI